MAAKYAILILSICLRTQGELKSPCPSVFNYQARDDSTDRWYGLLNLESNEDTVGVELKLTLDKPALQLGNLFGKTITYDLKEFVITNRFFRLAANSSHLLRLYVAYDPNKTAPVLINIERNDRRICPDSGHSGQSEVFVSVLVKPIPESILISSDNASVEEPLHETECGTIAAQASSLIVGGNVSEIREYPWHAAIYGMRNERLTYLCGGSLVSTQIVVTIVSCLGLHNFDIENIRVHLGNLHLQDLSSNVQIREVSERIRHPGYNPSSRTHNHNIGLLKLKKSVTFSDFVRPVCLNPPDTDFENLIGKIGTVPGWGVTETESLSEKLLYATLKVVSYRDCLSKEPGYYLSRSSFCAAPVNGSAPCTGDAGGGLVFPNDSNGRRKYHLRGISSFGHSKCGGSTYDVFTDVVEHLQFIKANL